MTNEEKMMIAIETARESLKSNDLPVGAVIFLGDEIIAKAHSYGESDKRFLTHAEMNALLEADKMCYPVSKRKQMQLFVTLEPCMMCLGASMAFFMGEIYYALESPIDGAVSFAQNSWKPENKEIPEYYLPKCYSGLLKKEAQDLLQEYIDIKQKGALVDFCKTLVEMH